MAYTTVTLEKTLKYLLKDPVEIVRFPKTYDLGFYFPWRGYLYISRNIDFMASLGKPMNRWPIWEDVLQFEEQMYLMKNKSPIWC